MLSRRGFAKWLAAMAGALLMPKGNKMTFDSLPYMRGQLGDLLAMENPALGDRQRIRMEMNKLQTQVSNLSAWMAPGGNLDPNLFQSHSSGFSMLPHECAAMYQSSAQTITTGTKTTIAPYDTASSATWSRGLEIDATNGYIYVTGIPRETVLLIATWVTWAANATGTRELHWMADDASSRWIVEFNPHATVQTPQQIIHVRRVASAQTYYYTQVEHSRGANLNVSGMGLVVARIR